MMRILIGPTLFALMGMAGAGTPGQVRHQETIEPQRSGEGAGGAGPALAREVFNYAVAGRRDPFLPVPAPAAAAARFRTIRLLGIISHHDPRRRVAVIRVQEEEDRSPPDPGSKTGENHRVSIGDRIGNIRVLVIDRRQVVLALDGPAGTSRRILEFDSEARSDSR